MRCSRGFQVDNERAVSKANAFRSSLPGAGKAQSEDSLNYEIKVSVYRGSVMSPTVIRINRINRIKFTVFGGAWSDHLTLDPNI